MLRRSRTERIGEPAALLVVGLGNPGGEHVGTRHNVGAEVIAVLADRHHGQLRKSKELALSCEVRIGGLRVALAFPQTYMNESGQSVHRLVRRHGIDDLTHLVVVHDELDLPVGGLRIKEGGGLAGHNGLRSIVKYSAASLIPLRNSSFSKNGAGSFAWGFGGETIGENSL